MKTQELKQGNWIEYQNKNFQVIGFDNDQVLLQDSFDFLGLAYVYSKNINPIPINKEWMLKLGFCEVYIDMYEIKPNVNGCECFSFHSDYNSITISDGFGNDYLVKNINYVHQLQNLYFSITQIELEIK